MGCGIAFIKYLIFIFNFVFALIGVAILAIGIWVLVELEDFEKITEFASSPAIALIVIGSVVFVIAFFGCCGAIRESHCMVITYAVFLLTILIVQVAIGIWAFVLSKNVFDDETKTKIVDSYRSNIFNNYWSDESDRAIVDSFQRGFSCCGVNSYTDFSTTSGFNGTIPWSCCSDNQAVTCTATTAYSTGCATLFIDAFSEFAVIIGGVAVGVAAVELIGIIFSLCLANSIRNDDRRGYRV